MELSSCGRLSSQQTQYLARDVARIHVAREEDISRRHFVRPGCRIGTRSPRFAALCAVIEPVSLIALPGCIRRTAARAM